VPSGISRVLDFLRYGETQHGKICHGCNYRLIATEEGLDVAKKMITLLAYMVMSGDFSYQTASTKAQQFSRSGVLIREEVVPPLDIGQTLILLRESKFTLSGVVQA